MARSSRSGAATQVAPSTEASGKIGQAPALAIHVNPFAQVRDETRPRLTTLIIIGADVGALALAAVAAAATLTLLGSSGTPLPFLRLWPLLSVFVLAYWLLGLYGLVGIGPAEELRRCSLATSTVFLLLGAEAVLSRTTALYPRLIVFAAWVVALAAVPIVRAVVRGVLARRPWWGQPVVILGAGRAGQVVVQTLRRHPGMGLKPIALLDDDPGKQGSRLGVPVPGGLHLGPRLAQDCGVANAIVAMPGVRPERVDALLRDHAWPFARVFVLPESFAPSGTWSDTKSLASIPGLEVRRQLLDGVGCRAKRALDVLATLLLSVVALPLMLLIVLAIRLESRGKALYAHRRIGRGGRYFSAWKFRSMVQNADRLLESYLDQHPDARAEWQESMKLTNDPRVTRVGRLLRKTSLDELPQLWNILTGEMSLVGPRPIVTDEIPKYADKFALYAQVRPGLSGLWQVSGRSDTSYDERVRLDTYYVLNWSVWLDLWVLARTVPVVLFGRGAR
ncbi:MAG TPA: undecaprenyl-phosphate galactose phosphotransferase WbaP [Polyangia bacterium]|jgi:Undecaprenyl-phosphate galactose phosphotransferase WbaP